MRRAYGWHDGLVTPKGREQIERLEKRFSDIHIDSVYSSDLVRTQVTAEAIYKPKNLPLHTKKGLREMYLGVWEDMPWGEIATVHPEAYENWCNAPLDFTVEKSETYPVLYNRARAALDEIAAENKGKTVAVVSHGAVLRTLMYGLVNNDELTGIKDFPWGDNTCVSMFRTEDGKAYEAVYLNDNSHLEDMPGYGDNMNWVSEGSALERNLYFVRAEYPGDKDKLREYYGSAWENVFGERLGNMRRVDTAVRLMLSEDSDSIAFGIGADGEVGVVALDTAEEVYPDAGHIALVYLKERFRRRKYGMQLIGYAISKYGKMGKRHVSVRVAETNEGAIAFYNKHGFYEVSRHNESGVRQIIMLLDIQK